MELSLNKFKKIYNKNIKLSKKYGFTKWIIKVFSLLLLILTLMSGGVSQTSYADYNNNSITIDITKEANSEMNIAREARVLTLTNKQIDLLSRLVSSEAKGESYEGQVAVASVVINRIFDERFPNTLEEVIYQQYAFEPVSNGTINQQATDSARKATIEAIYGSDPTNDSVYFWNPNTAKSKWIKQLNPHLRIGNHVFAR